MYVTLITTILNEEKSIDNFLDSFLEQEVFPFEFIIVDAKSTDATMQHIKKYESRIAKVTKFRLLSKKGNRAVGRNEAIKQAKGTVIACTDAGNILSKNWLKHITHPFTNQKIDVVAGYYDGRAKTVFQKCLVPYVLVMPDKLHPKSFLPATRSIAFTKKIWEKSQGFDERLSHNEDYAFAKKLKKLGAKIVFEKKAVVYWIPRSTAREAFTMFWRFAYGDIEAGIVRPKVLFLFFRYIVGLSLLLTAFLIRSDNMLLLICTLLLCYLIWAVQKNYRYVNDPRALYFLPLLQITSDVAVITGSIQGLFRMRNS